MYLEHWGLERSPFAPGPTPPFYYEGESQAEAAARLRFVARRGRRLALLSGLRGAGKSLTLSRFANECRRAGRGVVAVGLAGLTVRELLWQITAQLALGPRPRDDAIALFRLLAGSVESPASASANSGTVMLLDDADQAGPDVRSQLVRLLNLGGGRSCLTLVLAAAPDNLTRLGGELLDATDLCIDLEPWSDADTIGYIQHALLEAGCDRPAFDDEALAVLATLSGGVPRHVNRLADHALLAAAAAGLEAVDAGTIEATQDALSWLATA
jgi:general secretion pathway protein A